MKYKHIEAAREARLWTGQIIVPIISIAAMVLSNPETRKIVVDKTCEVKNNVKSLFRK